MKCANCNLTASHEYRLTLEKSIFYCVKHLPTFLRKAQKAKILPVTDEHKANLEEGFKNISVTQDKTSSISQPTKPIAKKVLKNADNS